LHNYLTIFTSKFKPPFAVSGMKINHIPSLHEIQE